MRIVAVANQKGGCGKTTTAVNMAGCLAFLGKKVLVVDLDSQGHAGLGLGILPENLDLSLYDVLSPTVDRPPALADVIIRLSPNLHLLPSSITLSALEQELSGADRREFRLSDALASIDGAYDFVFIDCAPGVGILLFNALAAAHEVLIPVEPSRFAVHGLERFLETVRLAEEIFDCRYLVHGLITNYDGRPETARRFLRQTQGKLKDFVLRTIIRRNPRLSDAAAAGRPISDFDRGCIGFQDYIACAAEVLERTAQRRTQERVIARLSPPAEEEARPAEEPAFVPEPAEIFADADAGPGAHSTPVYSYEFSPDWEEDLPRIADDSFVASAPADPELLSETQPGAFVFQPATAPDNGPAPEAPSTPSRPDLSGFPPVPRPPRIREWQDPAVKSGAATSFTARASQSPSTTSPESPKEPKPAAPEIKRHLIEITSFEGAARVADASPAGDPDASVGSGSSPASSPPLRFQVVSGPPDEERPAMELSFGGPEKRPEGIEFVLQAPEADSVEIAGEFNDWRPEPMLPADAAQGLWRAIKPLNEGVYRYKFVVNGRWINDPANRAIKPNPFGGTDTVVQV